MAYKDARDNRHNASMAKMVGKVLGAPSLMSDRKAARKQSKMSSSDVKAQAMKDVADYELNYYDQSVPASKKESRQGARAEKKSKRQSSEKSRKKVMKDVSKAKKKAAKTTSNEDKLQQALTTTSKKALRQANVDKATKKQAKKEIRATKKKDRKDPLSYTDYKASRKNYRKNN